MVYFGSTVGFEVSTQSGGRGTPQEYFLVQLSLNSGHGAGHNKKPDARSGFLMNLILSNQQKHSPVHEVVIEHDADADK